MSRMTHFLLAGVFSLTVTTAYGQTILYVDDTATGANDGSSWTDAFTDLQDALDAIATSCPDVTEVRVAAGTYKPSKETAPGDPRSATFQLANCVELFGGFPDGGGDWASRHPETNVTTLSGDLNGDDGPDFANNGENSYHVVMGSGTDATAVLDGFVITGGNANAAFPNNSGGGMYNNTGSPTVTNCIFIRNSVSGHGGHGGGMHNRVGSSPTVTNCTFSDNSSADEAGGMYNHDNSSPTVSDCTFTGNSAVDEGGGMHNRIDSHPRVINCTFSGNTALEGGGMDNDSSPMVISNCTFTNNSASNMGGGISTSPGSSPTVTNCTFTGNVAGGGGGMDNSSWNTKLINCTFISNSADGGGGMVNFGRATLLNCVFIGNSATDAGGVSNVIFSSRLRLIHCTLALNQAPLGNGGGISTSGGPVSLTNCVLWGNSDSGGSDEGAQIYKAFVGLVAVNYSCVQGWTGTFGGEGNIGDDPLFTSGPLGDYYLSQIASGQAIDSPSLDTGKGLAAQMFYTGTTRTDGVDDAAIVDMGYHYNGQVVTRGDLDGDTDVDVVDFLTFSSCFNGALNPPLPACSNWRADIDFDADVDIDDFLTFSGCFNGSLNPPNCSW